MADDALDLTTMVAGIAAAYVASAQIGVTEVGPLIERIAKTVASLEDAGLDKRESPPVDYQPTRAQIRKSITPEAIISFEDGRGYKTMRRHLAKHGITPEQYRQRWGLPPDYPMVAPNYSLARAALAKNLGLGKQVRNAAGSTSPPSKRAKGS